VADAQQQFTPGCTACGEVTPEMRQRDKLIAQLRETVAGLNAELTNKIVANRRLRGKQAEAAEDPLYEKALEVASYWKELLAPKTRELKGPRIEKTLARLRGDGTSESGYTVEELKRAVWGYYCRQFVVDGKRAHQGRKDQRYIDLELIMRDAKHVDAGITIADQDAASDVDMLRFGTSEPLAQLCDCGHPYASHLPLRLAIHAGTTGLDREPCLEDGCDCWTFDTVERQMEEWRRRQKAKLDREQRRAA
jgi:hypothetical protein